MDKTFSLTDVEQQWFPIEVIERYFRLARKLDIPQQLHRLSARGWVMLKALRVGAKRFYAFLHEKLNCTCKTEYRHPRWFKSISSQKSKESIMSDKDKKMNNQPFEPSETTVDQESIKQSTSKQEETTMNVRYDNLDRDTLARLAESEIHRNEAEAAYMRRMALDQKPDRKWQYRAGVALTATSAAAMGAIALFYLKHTGLFDGLLGGSKPDTNEEAAS